MGIDKTLRLLYKDPDAVHSLCKVSLETCKAYVKAAMDLGLNPTISEPMSSCTVVSPGAFRQFSLPYLKELVEFIQKGKKNPVIHICGQTEQIWKDLADMQIAGMSIDNVASLAKCKAAIGSQTRILGNVDPGGVMYTSSAEDVKIKTLEGIEEAWDSPKGYNERKRDSAGKIVQVCAGYGG